MARQINRLSARKVATETKQGLHADGGGLYLQVSTFDTKSWLFRFSLNKKTRDMGLGPIHTVTLSEARGEAMRCRKLLREGIDPIEQRKATRAYRQVESAKAMTFRDCSEAYIKSHSKGWRNAKHAAQWRSTLKTYVYPLFGALPVQVVDTGLVMKAVEPIWATKTETASRVRGRIESILNWATTRGYREGVNPAQWRGHLDNLLPARTKVHKIKHHAALSYDEMGFFMAVLREQGGVSARGLEFQILVATRTGETIGARWDEIDISNGVWTIPAERMKADKEHRVPLSRDAIAVLEAMNKTRKSDFVFPGKHSGHPLSNMAFLQMLKRMGRRDLTAHGFRSTFRDWAAECTAYPNEVAEMALAHAVGDKVEAAYRRGDLYDKRRRIMNDWGDFCSIVRKADGNVVAIRKT